MLALHTLGPELSFSLGQYQDPTLGKIKSKHGICVSSLESWPQSHLKPWGWFTDWHPRQQQPGLTVEVRQVSLSAGLEFLKTWTDASSSHQERLCEWQSLPDRRFFSPGSILSRNTKSEYPWKLSISQLKTSKTKKGQASARIWSCVGNGELRFLSSDCSSCLLCQ